MTELRTWGLAAAALAAMIGLELAGILAPLPQATALPAVASLDHPPADSAMPPQGWQATLLARPLFDPTRRPAEAKTLSRGNGLPRLTGVVITPDARRAIFAGGKVLGEGGMLGRYRIATIEAGRVTVHGPDGTAVLHPAFAGSASSAPLKVTATATASAALPVSPLREPK